MDRRGRSAVALAMATFMAVGGCATAPGAPGTDTFFVSTHAGAQGSQPTFAFAAPADPFPDPTLEASCTATNDLGSWTITAPGKFEVATSREPLKITCRRDGYLDASVELRCVHFGSQSALAGTRGLMMAGGVYGIVLLPLIVVAAAAAQSAQQSSVESGTCDYTFDSKLHIWLKPPA